jgi:serine/threonine protein kinase
MSTVYLAVQKSVNRYVALKVMSSELIDDESYTKRFLSEARIAARFRHPNIISIFDVNVSGGVPYIAMEHVPGGELDTDRIKSMNLTEKLSVLVQTADALGFLHSLNFVHRDIKPGNILFREDNSVVLTDFGVARDQAAQQHDTLAGYIIGTPHYLSPEQAQGEEVDARSDLYSLGVMMYRLLTLQLPYVADDAISVCTMHVYSEIPDLPKEFEKFNGIVKKAMAKSPDDRHQSANEFIDDLISATGSTTGKLLRRSMEGVALQAIDPDDEHTTTREQVQITEEHLKTKVQAFRPDTDQIRRKSQRALKKPNVRKITAGISLVRKTISDRYVLGGLVASLLVMLVAAFVYNFKGSLQEADTPRELRDRSREMTETPRELTDTSPQSTDKSPTLTETPPMESAPAEAPPSDVAQEPAGPGAEPDADELLSRAREALNQGIYVRPEQVSAYGYYLEALNRDPGNQQALAGLEELAESLLDLVEASIALGQTSVAEQFLADANQTGYADPGRVELLNAALRGGEGESGGEVETGVEGERRVESEGEVERGSVAEDEGQRQQIIEALDRGYDYLNRRQLTVPVDANAVAEFNRVLDMDGNNADALAGLEQVGVLYLELAREQIANDNIVQAEAYWQKAHTFAPGTPDIDQVWEAIETHRRNAARETAAAPAPAAPAARSAGVPGSEIVAYRLPSVNVGANESNESLYDRAEQAMKSGHRMESYALYKKVRERDPDFRRAERRLSSGAGSYLNVASRDIMQGNLTSAGKNLSIALALDPGHPKFNPVKRDYQAAVDRANSSSGNRSSTSLADIQVKTIMEDAESYHSLFQADSSNPRAATRAQARYREVLAIRSNDAAARDGLNRLF